jgi:hypothetical protein
MNSRRERDAHIARIIAEQDKHLAGNLHYLIQQRHWLIVDLIKTDFLPDKRCGSKNYLSTGKLLVLLVS